METTEAIRTRRSIKTYDPDYEVADDTLHELFSVVRQSPSSFNLQHTRFVVIRDKDKRRKLMEAAYDQPHVGAAPAVVIVAAKLAAHEDADRANGHAPEDVRAKLVPMIQGMYQGNALFQRDEAIRSGSLTSMTLMLAAQDMGLCTCPMIGFDQKKVAEIAGLDEGHVIVMLITLGKRGDADVFPTSRFELAETVKLESLSGDGLAHSHPHGR